MNDLLLISLVAWREAEKREATNHLLTGVKSSEGSERILHEVRVLVDRVIAEQGTNRENDPKCNCDINSHQISNRHKLSCPLYYPAYPSTGRPYDNYPTVPMHLRHLLGKGYE